MFCQKLWRAHQKAECAVNALVIGRPYFKNITFIVSNDKLFHPAGPPESGTVHAGGLHWTYGPEDRNDRYYWDFAAAARTLRTAYFDHECERESDGTRRKVNNMNWDCTPLPCFHQDSLNLLHLLQTRAWSKIRSEVFLTLGTVFSLELTEQTFHLSLTAEEMPMDPRAKAPEGFFEPLPEYYCTQFEDSDDEDDKDEREGEE